MANIGYFDFSLSSKVEKLVVLVMFMHQKALLSVLLVTYTRRIFQHGNAGIVS